MDSKGYPNQNQGENPPPGFYVPPQPPPAYDAGQPNYQYPPQQQQHLVQRMFCFSFKFLYESFTRENYL